MKCKAFWGSDRKGVYMRKGITFILILLVGMVGLTMAGMSETMAGGISFAAAIAYAVLTGGNGESDDD